MLNFGKWMTGLSISSFLFTQGDDAFLGWFLGATALGFYQMAYQLARAPSTEITQVISQVLFPTYSKIQDDVSALRSAYFRMLKIAITISAPLSVGIVVVSPLFVRIFLGAEWMGAVVPMQILALWGLLLSIGSTSGPLFQARGRPDYITKVNVMKTLALAVLIFPATQRFGVAGTAGAVVCSALLTSEPIINYLAVREVEGRLRTFFWTLSIPLASSAVMAGGLVAVQQGVTIQPNPVHFVLYVATGAVIYILSMLLFEELFGYGSIAEFRSLVKLVT